MLRKILLGWLSLLILLAPFAGVTAAANPTSFCFALGLSADEINPGSLGRCSIVVVDGVDIPRPVVSALKKEGAQVLGYLSIGTIEKRRYWFKLVKNYRLDLWDDWQEWYADVSKEKFRQIMGEVVAPRILRKGFDGLFLDNVDMIADHRKQTPGMLRLVRTLRQLTRRQKKVLFAQNGFKVIRSFVPYLNGWNMEDVFSFYNFETGRYERQDESTLRENISALSFMRDKGLVVSVTDYVAAGDFETEEASIRNACAAGVLPFVSNIELTRMPSEPYKCTVLALVFAVR